MLSLLEDSSAARRKLIGILPAERSGSRLASISIMVAALDWDWPWFGSILKFFLLLLSHEVEKRFRVRTLLRSKRRFHRAQQAKHSRRWVSYGNKTRSRYARLSAGSPLHVMCLQAWSFGSKQHGQLSRCRDLVCWPCAIHTIDEGTFSESLPLVLTSVTTLRFVFRRSIKSTFLDARMSYINESDDQTF